MGIKFHVEHAADLHNFPALRFSAQSVTFRVKAFSPKQISPWAAS
jgi:hypothetical protein